jgi:hypothetical protein
MHHIGKEGRVLSTNIKRSKASHARSKPKIQRKTKYLKVDKGYIYIIRQCNGKGVDRLSSGS